MRATEVVLIGNPASGGTGTSRLERAADTLRELGVRVDFQPTEGPGHATELARRAGDRRVVAAGGDGTVNEVINGLSSGAELAVLPLGTANVLARELGIPRHLKDACRRVVGGEVLRVDLGVATRASGEERRFSCMAGIGFDARVIQATSPKLERYPKVGAFLLATMEVYVKEQPPLTLLSSGGKGYEARFAIVANARRYAGEFRASEQASLTSGCLEVVVVEKVGPLLRPGMLSRILARRPLGRYVQSFSTQELSATSDAEVPVQLDGELWGELPVSFRIEPRALSVVR